MASRNRRRGDDYFEHFDERLAALVRENETGRSLCFVLVEGDREVLGRVNVSDIDRPGLTEVGFRIAEHAQGRGLATQGVRTALDIAASRGVGTVVARVSTANLASLAVLRHCGFIRVGRTEAPDGSAERFVLCRKELGTGD